MSSSSGNSSSSRQRGARGNSGRGSSSDGTHTGGQQHRRRSGEGSRNSNSNNNNSSRGGRGRRPAGGRGGATGNSKAQSASTTKTTAATAAAAATATAAAAAALTDQDHQHRFEHAVANMVGSDVTIRKKSDGVKVTGIFDGITSKPLTFRVALATAEGGNAQKDADGLGAVSKLLGVPASVTAELYCPGLNLISETNRGIMASVPVEPRNLTEASDWLAGGDAAQAQELKPAADTATWDQFKANEHLTDGKSMAFTEQEFEAEYTTTLKPSKFSAEEMRAAEALAKDISTGDAGGNIHVAEERGQKVAGLDNVSEEDRFSGVLGNRVGEQGNHTMRAGRGGGAGGAGAGGAEAAAAATAPASASAPAPAPALDPAPAPASSSSSSSSEKPAPAPAPAAKSSTLKADAPEFVPSFAMSAPAAAVPLQAAAVPAAAAAGGVMAMENTGMHAMHPGMMMYPSYPQQQQQQDYYNQMSFQYQRAPRPIGNLHFQAQPHYQHQQHQQHQQHHHHQHQQHHGGNNAAFNQSNPNSHHRGGRNNNNNNNNNNRNRGNRNNQRNHGNNNNHRGNAN